MYFFLLKCQVNKKKSIYGSKISRYQQWCETIPVYEHVNCFAEIIHLKTVLLYALHFPRL